MKNKDKNIKILTALFWFYQVIGIIALYSVLTAEFVRAEYVIARGLIVFACIISCTVMLKHLLITRDETE